MEIIRTLSSLLRRFWFSPAVIGPLLIARHVIRHRRLPPLFAPQSYNDKLLHRLVFDRRPILTRLAGKLETRDYALERTGNPALLVDLIGTASNTAELAALDLPSAFIAKPNHLSGFTHIHRGPEPPDIAAIGAKLARWSQYRGRSEWGYDGVRRTCLIERLMLDQGRIPNDYKFFCYGGRVHFVQVTQARFEDPRFDFFRPDWTWIDMRHMAGNADRRPERPSLLAEMTDVAETLSYGLDFARVDLYGFDGQVKVGEMTIYPNRGLSWFDPPSADAMFGEPWVLPRHGSG